MTILEVPPPPKQCPLCLQPMRITLYRDIARCTRGHVYQFDRTRGVWTVTG